MQEVDDKKLSDLSKRFLQAISYCGLSGYKLKKDNIISSESTLTSIKKGIQLPSKKTIDAFCEKYDVSRAWLYTGEGLFAKTPSGQIEPSEKDIRDALKNARMQSDSTISKVAPYLQDILVKVKYVPIDAAASFVESLYNTAYEIDSYGVMPEEGEVLDDSYMVFQVTRSFEKQGFSMVLEEEEITDEKLLDTIHQLYDNRHSFEEAMSAGKQMDSIHHIVSLIEECVLSKK